MNFVVLLTIKYYHDKFIDSMVLLKKSDEVAECFNKYISQACERVCKTERVKGHRSRGVAWFDRECREKRVEAIKAGERVESDADFNTLNIKCKEYRSLKQRKQRGYKQHCVEQIGKAHDTHKTNMWKMLSNDTQTNQVNVPCGNEFVKHYTNLSNSIQLYTNIYKYIQDIYTMPGGGGPAGPRGAWSGPWPATRGRAGPPRPGILYISCICLYIY